MQINFVLSLAMMRRLSADAAAETSAIQNGKVLLR